MSNVASASLPDETRLTPGVLFRVSAFASAVVVGLVVVSAVLELGATHWGIALVALPLLVANVVLARIAYPGFVPRTLAALASFLVAIALGGLVAWSGQATWAAALHVGAAGVALAFALVVAATALRGEAGPLASARDYLILTKPRIMTLLLLTGAAGMFVGAQGVPPLDLFVVTMLGLALACGGASALNHVLDRDIDKLMGSRTEKRPVATGRVSPEQALEFGILLSAVSFALLASAVNVLTAVLALVGNLFYVLVYTRWLKRSTPQNIVIGGAAGAVPPLVGYAAATGSLALPALWLFLIVFLWTPPHFWALALMIKNAYASAGIPMLPVVRGDRETARQIVLYSLAMVAFTVVVGVWLGPLYTAAAVVLGAIFVALAVLLRRDLSRARAQVLFHYSLLYLALLFTAAALDPVLM
ncbi:MAG TPA: heme o synthase [Gaiellaceae bacterium]|nr:heme o synthase [Gaiellaceae bacterium]